MAELDLNGRISKLEQLKQLIDAEIEKVQQVIDSTKSDFSFFDGLDEIADVKDQIEGDTKKANKEKIQKAQVPLKLYISTIDRLIIENAEVQAELIKGGNQKLEDAINALTNGAMVAALSKVGIKMDTKTAATMRQLDEVESHKLDDFDTKYKAAEELAKKAELRDSIRTIRAADKDPKAELEAFKNASEAKIAEIAELNGAKEYVIADEIVALQEKTDKKRGKPRYNKEADKKFDEILKHLELLAGTDLDKEIEVQGMGKVKLSELAQKGINDRVVKSNVLKAILPLVKDQEKINAALETKSQAKKQELAQLVEDNSAYLGLIEVDGKKSFEAMKKLLSKENFSTADYKALLDKLINDKTFKDLEALEKADPKKFEGAKEAFAKLKALRDKGYEGKEVSEQYTRNGISLDFLGRDKTVLKDIDFESLQPEEYAQVSERIFKGVYDNGQVKQEEQKRLRALVEKEYNAGKLIAGKKPYHIPILSDLKRLFGFKTAQDKWYENLLKQKIHSEIRVQVEGKLHEDDKADHAEVRAAWELDQAQAKKFREAERRLVVEGKGSADLATVKEQAEAEALKEDGRE